MKLNPFRQENPQRAERKLREEEIESQEVQQLRELASVTGAARGVPRDNVDLVKWQQNSDPLLDGMTKRLKGFTLDEDGSWKPIMVNGKQINPLCDGEFCGKLVALLGTYCTQHTMMSNYSEKFILKKLKDLSYDVVYQLLEFGEDHSILLGNYSTIVHIFQGCSEAVMYRALLGGERKYLQSTTQNIFARQEKGEPIKKKGLFRLGTDVQNE